MSLTENKRIYAIGDIHGCLDDLVAMQTRIAEDLKARPHPDPVTIYLGDYMDRGPNSKGVIDNLIAQQNSIDDTRFLFGNHDQMLLDFLKHPAELATAALHWLDPRLGGIATIESYGIPTKVPEWLAPNGPGADILKTEGIDSITAAIHRDFKAAHPSKHQDFIENAELYIQIGHYVFVHAGIRPGVSLENQIKQDLVWIREPFLSSTEDHGFCVVHGHSPVREVKNYGNRIAVDTGAVFGRELSCVVLEDDTQSLLTPTGLRPCPVIPH